MTSIHDFGIKIGGARKDQEIKAPTKQTSIVTATRPAWRRYYEIRKINHPAKPYHIYRCDRYMRWNCASEEEAEKAIPEIEAARRYRVYRDRRSSEAYPRFVLYRQTGKSWTEVGEPKEGFTSVEEGEQYIVANATMLLEFKFTPPERPYLEEVKRSGQTHRTGNVSPSRFQSTFAFRGGEFGNWNQGKSGQISLNHAYDALHDLATVLDIVPNALSLDSSLSIAFGARGHGGKNASRAHYERAYAVFNLTKIRGAGALAHEWMHGLDHWLARLDGKSKSERDEHGKFKVLPREVDYLSHGISRQSKLPAPLIEAAQQLTQTIRYKTITRARNLEVAEKNVERMKGRLAEELNRLTTQWEDGRYTKRFKAPSFEQKEAWQTAVANIKANNPGEPTLLDAIHSYLGIKSFSFTNLDILCNLYKQTHNRSLTSKSDPDSTHSRLRTLITLQQNAIAEYEKAKAGETETVQANTDFYNEAREIDKTRTDPYWATPHEMMARAFEAWIYDEIVARGNRSDYLVYGVENWYYILEGWKPYPEGDERLSINQAFRDFFAVVCQTLPSFTERRTERQETVTITVNPPSDPIFISTPISLKQATQLSLF